MANTGLRMSTVYIPKWCGDMRQGSFVVASMLATVAQRGIMSKRFVDGLQGEFGEGGYDAAGFQGEGDDAFEEVEDVAGGVVFVAPVVGVPPGGCSRW